MTQQSERWQPRRNEGKPGACSCSLYRCSVRLTIWSAQDDAAYVANLRRSMRSRTMQEALDAQLHVSGGIVLMLLMRACCVVLCVWGGGPGSGWVGR